MATTFSELDGLSADEQALLESLLARVAVRNPFVVVNFTPTDHGPRQMMMAATMPPEPFEWDDPSIDDAAKREFKRRLAHPEEFIPIPRLKCSRS